MALKNKSVGKRGFFLRLIVGFFFSIAFKHYQNLI